MELLTIQPAQVIDVEDILGLVQSVYRGDNSRRGWTTEADLLDGQRADSQMITDYLCDPASLFLIARDDAKILASVLLQKNDGFAYLGMLSVDVSAQNLKLGRRMIDAAAELVKSQWKLAEIRITVINVRHELIAWYRRRGFVLTGRTSPFSNDPRFGIPKVPGLEFVELSLKL